MNKIQVIEKILQSKNKEKRNNVGSSFAPVNIALCKYWGKRNKELNLPITSSLSISLKEKGAFTKIELLDDSHDKIIINDSLIDETSPIAKRLSTYLDLFRPKKIGYIINIDINIPIAAGLASSACIYASIIQAIDKLYNWKLEKSELSILARLGSGSACRSIWDGFVEWQMGNDENGMDSFGFPIKNTWQDLRIGLDIINTNKKPISSREAMERTVKTSILYLSWPKKVNKDIINIKRAIKTHDFELFGRTTETNAIAMHATMMDAHPQIIYSQSETIEAIEKIWELRKYGILVYFTQDAGPNLKLIFLNSDTKKIKEAFPSLEILTPFPNPNDAQVILVDENDKILGTADKLVVHKQAKLHRAFSIFIIRKCKNDIEILLQKRQRNKYHCENLWSNTCCSHPHPGENTIAAAKKRLQEEMGFTTELYPIGKLQYEAQLDNGLVEKELDHIFIGTTNREQFTVNKNEVQDYKWIKLTDLEKDLEQHQNKYTPWLLKILNSELLRYKVKF